MKYDITALGEILIDFIPSGRDSAGDLIFVRKAGGAPVNLLATVSKFGGKVRRAVLYQQALRAANRRGAGA